MVLSFHPLVVGQENIICAGRKPDGEDLKAIRRADAVILPLGCRRELYFMARDNCDLVFPNYDARFSFSGKIGQIRLFRKTNAKHPRTLICENLDSCLENLEKSPGEPPVPFPFVFKFDWGGEGKNVFLIRNHGDWRKILDLASRFENTGQKGFLIQELVDSQNKSLRSVVIGARIVSYWRVAQNENQFKTGLSSGARIDCNGQKELVDKAEQELCAFIAKTGINLAGFDILFSSENRKPYMLEINYFFGRRGLGGSEKFNGMLVREINRWLLKAGRPERVSLYDI